MRLLSIWDFTHKAKIWENFHPTSSIFPTNQVKWSHCGKFTSLVIHKSDEKQLQKGCEQKGYRDLELIPLLLCGLEVGVENIGNGVTEWEIDIENFSASSCLQAEIRSKGFTQISIALSSSSFLKSVRFQINLCKKKSLKGSLKSRCFFFFTVAKTIIILIKVQGHTDQKWNHFLP